MDRIQQQNAHLEIPNSINGESSSSRGSSSVREAGKEHSLPQDTISEVPVTDAQQAAHNAGGGNGFQVFETEPDDEQPSVNTSLSEELSERHVNMITLSACIGIGLFLQNGRVINLAGPGMAWLAYPLMGSILWSVQAILGEMSALFPVPGALFELPCRFLDLSIGYAVGWMSWFAWVVIIAAELQGVAGLFKFRFDPTYLADVNFPQKTLEWSTDGTKSAVWIGVFLLGIWGVNLLRVKYFGEIEYWLGVCKICFLVGLIMFNLIINVQQGLHFRFYNDPWGFISRSWTAPNGVVYTGGSAHLAGIWSAMTLTVFSMIGFEAVTITAAENRNSRTFEGVKISSRKIALRIILLYTLATFTVGLNLPYDDANLTNPQISVLDNGSHSAFIIAAVRAGKTFWPKFFNGFFILSATSSGINSLYLSSRILHGLALADEVWPKKGMLKYVQLNLKQTGLNGVPYYAVFASWLFGFLGFLAAGKSPSRHLGRMALNATVSMLLVYIVICVTFLRFRTILQTAASAGGLQRLRVFANPGVNLEAYSRDKSTRTFPYRASWQPARTVYALFGCTMMLMFNGWRAFVPFSASDFVASYISIFIFIALCLLYRCKLHWGAVFRLELHPSLNLRNPVMADTNHPMYGRDGLRFAPEDSRIDRLWKTVAWVWIWVK